MTRNLFSLTAIIVFALLMRIIFFIGPSNPDEFLYFQCAYNIFHGKFDIANEVSSALRFAVFLPAGIFFKLFGVSDYTAMAWPLICSLSEIILIYLIAKTLFNAKTGILAAAFLSIVPLNVLYSIQVMPDVVASVFMALFVYIFLKIERNPLKEKSFISYLFLGIFAGLGCFIRANAPISAFLFLIFYIFISRKKFVTGYFFIILGFLLVALAEIFFYYLKTGDFLWGALIGELSRNEKPAPDLLYYPKAIFSPLGYFGIFYYFSFTALLYLIFTKKLNNIAIPLSWFISNFLYLEFGPLGATTIPSMARYLSIITMPAVIIFARFLIIAPIWQISIPEKYWKALSRLTVIIFAISIAALPLFYLFKEKAFSTAKNVYNLTKHAHSFEGNIEIINSLYKKMAFILSIFTAVGSIFSFFILYNKKKSQWFKLISLVFLLIILPSSVISINIHAIQHKASIEKYRMVYEFFKESGYRPIYCIHWRWPTILSYYFRYKEGSRFLCKGYMDYSKSKAISSVFKYAQNAKDLDELKNSYVIVDKEFLIDSLGSPKPPDFIYHIPKTWQARKIFRDVTIYYVN